MKRRFFSTLLLAVLFLFALNLNSNISWKSDPLITSFPSTFIKYVDIVSGESNWHYGGAGGTASVYVSADLPSVVAWGFATGVSESDHVSVYPFND